MKAVRSCLEALRTDLPAAGVTPGRASLTAIWSLDETVPTDLATRWARTDPSGVLARDFLRSMMNAGALVILLASVTGLATRAGDPLVWATFAGLAIAALVLGWSSHRRSGRRPEAFTAREIDLIVEHRRLVSFGDWDTYGTADAPREVTGARRADELARTVRALPCWSSELLAEHRIRLDPTDEAAAIRMAARELYDLRARLPTATTDDGSIFELDLISAEWNEHLERSWRALDARIAAFDQYVQGILELAVLTEKSELARQLAASLDACGPRLSVQTVTHEMATGELQQLRSELLTGRLGLRGESTLRQVGEE